MKLTVAALILGLIFFGASQALAAISSGCASLGGDPASPPGECQINTLVTAGGSFTVPEKLHITGTGKIDVGSPGLTVDIGNGLVMDAGSLIDGNVSGCGTGWPITLAVLGDASLGAGSTIRSDSCSGGAIVITAKTGNIDADGLVESVGSISGTGTNQAPGGGPISINAACNLTITDAGKVSSRGQDPGADLVHLQGGCKVVIDGLVESTGVGHGVPNKPKNHCDSAYRADKPTNSTACVEVWAGDFLTLDSTGTHNGQVNADTGGPGGSGGTSWIDLFARGDITLIGNTSGTLFDVHANGKAGTNDNGGVITVKSRDGGIRASGTALQADAVNPGGRGGSIDIEAALGVNLNDAQIFARGDFVATGGYGYGGNVTVQSFSGSLSWQDTATTPAATGDVRPTGTGVPTLRRGVITFINCTGGTVTTTGTLFPFIGAATTPTTMSVVGPCSGSPSFNLTYVQLPSCLCGGCFCITSFVVDNNILTINGESLNGVNEVDFNTSCQPGGIVVPKAAFLSQSNTLIMLTLPGGTSGRRIILVSTLPGTFSCSMVTVP